MAGSGDYSLNLPYCLWAHHAFCWRSAGFFFTGDKAVGA